MLSQAVFWLSAAAFALRISTDALMVEALRQRDPAALRQLVDRHHAALVGLAQSIVGRRGLAEEVAQETWLAVFAHIDQFDGRAQLSTWIIAILMNKAKSLARRERRYVALPEQADGEMAAPFRAVAADRFDESGHWREAPAGFDGLDPERILAGRQLWHHVDGFIAALPPAQRAVMILRDVEGHDAAETCRLLDISPENQRVLLHRARARVRSLLEALTKGAAPPAAAT
ncbi:RNA polymerase sigma factor [Methylobrevis albus]|uniref:Sigma-70 family RNA polymerase sigma factor n=1 Tax=Methylobrevis albus TaxID=2793297 RepID=A0A931I0V7_9HYPH|nr:sigma-70 family RNA polymerase sigma factor [Methylobrevis albus]MBH0237196.1 sigma-70 family RNA polymerase sigma factor [Methylobrevis albus]